VIDHYACGRELRRLSRLHAEAWVKDFGSAGFHLAGVACAMFDAFVSSDQKGHELAAGYLLIKEAGGCILDLRGRPIDHVRFDFSAKYDVVASGDLSLAQAIVTRVENVAESGPQRGQ
jgi:fructose-1,6-bisphosphatase/inositol monophosphatase family enzyme